MHLQLPWELFLQQTNSEHQLNYNHLCLVINSHALPFSVPELLVVFSILTLKIIDIERIMKIAQLLEEITTDILNGRFKKLVN